MKSKNKKIMTMQKKLLILGCVTIFIIVSVLQVANIIMQQNIKVSDIYDQTDMLAESYSSSIENVISRVYFEMDILTKDTEIADNYLTMDDKTLQSYLLDNRTKKTMFYTVSLIDPKGVTYDGYDISQRDYFQKAIAGTPNISSPVYSAKDKIMTYYVAQKMNNGKTDGVVFAGLNIEYFYDIIKGYEESNTYGGMAFIVDSNGTYIVSSDDQKVSKAINPIKLAEKEKK